jgi:acyl dehydratase
MAGIRYLEDLTVGERLITHPMEVTEADAIGFAKVYDPQPMHTDPGAAALGPFSGLIASGWHTTAMVMRLIVDSNPLGGAPVLGLGVDQIRWPNPLRPGDTIHAEIEITSITPSQSKPDFGVVRLNVRALNQRNEVVLTMNPNLSVARRPT